MSQLLKQIHNLYLDFYDKEGNIMDEPVGTITRLSLPESHIKFLKRFLEFIMNSKILNESTKIYITSPLASSSINSTFAYWNKNNPNQQVNIKTATSNVDYCRRKIIKLFEDDMISMLTYYPQKADIDHYEEQLKAAMLQYSNKSTISGSLMIDLGKFTSYEPVGESRLFEFMETIGPYRTKLRKTIEATINNEYADVIGYLNYLQAIHNKTPDQEETWVALLNFLNGSTGAGKCRSEVLESSYSVNDSEHFEDIEIDFD